MEIILERLVPYPRSVIAGIHVALVTAAYFGAFLIRHDFQMPAGEWDRFLETLPLLLLVKVVVFAWFHLYDGLWWYVSMRDILVILKAVTLSSLFFLAGVLLLFGQMFPRSIFALDWVLCLALVGGVRLATRAFRETSLRYGQAGKKRVLIVGAGDAGEMLVREIERNPELNYEVAGFVDDDPRKQRKRIHGIEVVGTIDQLPHLCHSRGVRELHIAMPSVTRDERRRIVERCRMSGVTFRTVPAMKDLLEGKAGISQLREVQAEDLLGREAVRFDVAGFKEELAGKRILVTGAAGSIGSELCRQLAKVEPELLILFDRAESSLYFAHLEVAHDYPRTQVIPVIGDILDRGKIDEVLQMYSPEVIYHAAAYKHVPLMEAHPLEAIENNIFGTENLALAARQMGVKKFILISTDKAVRPVGIMGMTKRVAEGLLLSLDRGPTLFLAVRFGNVLGSDGSVLPLFQWQITRGGPVTVTDPEASRYFMLLSEAVQLVFQAGMIAKGGGVFFLDMGEPVRIMTLAEDLIRASGMEPGKDVHIDVVGLRSGERLQESLVIDEEKFLPTEHEKVLMVEKQHFDGKKFLKDLEDLRGLVERCNRHEAVQLLKLMATRY